MEVANLSFAALDMPGGLTMPVHGGKADIPQLSRDIRFLPDTDMEARTAIELSSGGERRKITDNSGLGWPTAY
jgi:hypothetical protein